MIIDHGSCRSELDSFHRFIFIDILFAPLQCNVLLTTQNILRVIQLTRRGDVSAFENPTVTFSVGENWQIVGKVLATTLFDGTNVGDVVVAILAKVEGTLDLRKKQKMVGSRSIKAPKKIQWIPVLTRSLLKNSRL